MEFLFCGVVGFKYVLLLDNDSREPIIPYLGKICADYFAADYASKGVFHGIPIKSLNPC